MNELRTTVRAKSLITGKYIKGAYFDGYILEGSMIEANDEYCVVEQWTPIDKDTLGAFTGGYDMHNKPIYENNNVIVHKLNVHKKCTILENGTTFMFVDDNGIRVRGVYKNNDDVEIVDRD
ncbi:hypothetical protein [Macrococcus capreoli]|uniref:hypothetical protein n=1 Tax=Macrococcus capreoli TaxID=2982690 RepID=UPI0021D5C2B8|nr:hypothetical protein [Macrococcus sp. TMW 2.2395]MCU7557272.1 hypothetical protein [Macrococcus sp. TMW 2.2395]